MKADILQMSFADNEFDTIIVEAVTMFVNREKAIQEMHRVCKNGGKIVEHEFIWRKKPTADVRRIFEGEVCPNIKFDTAEDWLKLFEENGFKNENSTTGPFVMMSLGGFLNDEGVDGTMAMMMKTFSRTAYIKKMMWLMIRIMKVRSYLGYIVFSTIKTV
jgi:SAM-dependent methyltransferase